MTLGRVPTGGAAPRRSRWDSCTEISDLGDREGIVEFLHIRKVKMTCKGCGKSKTTEDAKVAERFVSGHSWRCEIKEAKRDD